MTHWLVVPVLLPLFTAVLLIFMAERGLAGGGRRAQRVVSVLGTLALVAVAAVLLNRSIHGSHEVYHLGNWEAPYGIVLVLDRLSAMMVALTSLIALVSVIYASHGSDTESHYFHPMFQLQLAGLMGAFLTGDLFNLFVFFEILLIASYCLLVYGGSGSRVRAGVHYVVINLVGSALFLIAIGTLYGVTGTLNMADLSLRVAELGPSDAGLVRAGALLLLVVFGVKAALVPLYFWLPNTYAAANASVAALFAIMTKVGVYCIVRVCTLIFGPESGVAAMVAESWLMPAALVTLALGAIGAFASRHLRRMQGYLLISSTGTMLASIGVFTAAALGAGLYYLVHSTIAIAAMFLLVDLVARQRGPSDDRLERSLAPAQPALLGLLFFAGAIAIAGVPPFSGFIGKGLILAAAPAIPSGWWLWGTLLGGSLLSLVALARAGSMVFWNTFDRSAEDDPFSRVVPAIAPRPHHAGTVFPVFILFGMLVVLTVFAGPISDFMTQAAEQLLAPEQYIRAVLGAGAGR